MMNKADRVAASKARALVEELLIAKKPYAEISQVVAEKAGEAFEPDEIRAYDNEYLKSGKGLITQVLDVAKDLHRSEIPAIDEVDQIAKHFSFQKTNEDLEMIYDRIRALKRDAALNPGDDTYDARIVKYLAQAEAIRSRVIKNQFDNLRKTILLNIGKKIASAAVSVFMPYVSAGKRDEAKRRFMSAIEPLIDAEVTPDVPEDIQEVESDLNVKENKTD
jgi:hypothetical protein